MNLKQTPDPMIFWKIDSKSHLQRLERKEENTTGFLLHSQVKRVCIFKTSKAYKWKWQNKVLDELIFYVYW